MQRRATSKSSGIDCAVLEDGRTPWTGLPAMVWGFWHFMAFCLCRWESVYPWLTKRHNGHQYFFTWSNERCSKEHFLQLLPSERNVQIRWQVAQGQLVYRGRFSQATPLDLCCVQDVFMKSSRCRCRTSHGDLDRALYLWKAVLRFIQVCFLGRARRLAYLR